MNVKSGGKKKMANSFEILGFENHLEKFGSRQQAFRKFI